jgi:hypothetical protein
MSRTVTITSVRPWLSSARAADFQRRMKDTASSLGNLQPMQVLRTPTDGLICISPRGARPLSAHLVRQVAARPFRDLPGKYKVTLEGRA